MKKLLVAAALTVAAISPAVATAADPTPADSKNAAKYCKALKDAAGSTSFVSMFGTKKNAYGKCVSQTKKEKPSKAERADRISAAESCKSAKKDTAKFAADFGTAKNAFGKCVSKTAEQLAAERKAEQETATA